MTGDYREPLAENAEHPNVTDEIALEDQVDV